MTAGAGGRKQRPDTSKNGLMKKRQLLVKDESVKERGRDILSRLGKRDR
ncbi:MULTISPECIES: hypothetical protein [Brevibacillus]|uniref:Uncharacterized protein n=1 Tax=Brevibacillus thermoruber TaxID=33942 RepID=A0A9X3Z3U3_9BACL|nr:MULTISPECIES: hypothetical protein [Brevibacillus]MDA5109098.1 hypothetical protein [Brevibacillus thermoruber]UYZ13047.1 hypothetical protein A6764_20055 [Brevibacillus sp. WF146]